MQEEYEYIILGTGISSCILSWALASQGKKVIQIDKNSTYGSTQRSLRYSELVNLYQEKELKELKALDKYFSIDLTPKLLLADGDVKNLLHSLEIFEMVDFVTIPGSFMYKKNKIHTLPSSETEALKSGLVSFFQKPRVVQFFWDLKKSSKDCKYRTMRDYFSKFSLDKDSQEFIGHAIAMNLDDSYLDRPPQETLDKIKMSIRSLLAFENNLKSPYIYPMYGISEISQFFSRKAAINNAVFRLNCKIKQIYKKEDFYVEIEDTTLKSKYLIAEPEYFVEIDVKKEVNDIKENEKKVIKQLNNLSLENDTILQNEVLFHTNQRVEELAVENPNLTHEFKKESDSKIDVIDFMRDKIQEINEVVFCICIIKGDVQLIKGAPSAQVIFSAYDLNRKNDIFLLILSERECACPENYKIAIISTVKETDSPESEISFVTAKLDNIVQKFISVRKVYRPTGNLKDLFVTKTVDQSTHFESLYENVVEIGRLLGVSKIVADDDL